jgi:cytoskeletal protein RodZ
MVPDSAPGGFGAKLRHARERRGISVRQVANATKISVAALEALERNDVARLPGGIFSRAFVRAYAIEVGLDPETTIQEFLAEFPHDAVAPAASTSDADEIIDNDQQVASIVLKLLLVSIPIAGAVLYFVMTGRPASPPPAPPAPADSTGDAATPAAAAPVALAMDKRFGGPARNPAPFVAVSQPSSVDGRLTATIAVLAASWVAATADGRQVLARDMTPGERFEVGPAQTIDLIVGDPAAIAVTVNGRQVRALGPAGQRTTTRLTQATVQGYLAPQ